MDLHLEHWHDNRLNLGPSTCTCMSRNSASKKVKTIAENSTGNGRRLANSINGKPLIELTVHFCFMFVCGPEEFHGISRNFGGNKAHKSYKSCTGQIACAQPMSLSLAMHTHEHTHTHIYIYTQKRTHAHMHALTHARTHQKNEQTNERANEQTNKRTNERTSKHSTTLKHSLCSCCHPV